MSAPFFFHKKGGIAYNGGMETKVKSPWCGYWSSVLVGRYNQWHISVNGCIEIMELGEYVDVNTYLMKTNCVHIIWWW